ncbi:MAG TPA: hypothetical protein VMW26_05790 [Methanomassiliicoccales archaeon]|nr:hypothetical protein [Methanomassiliicoccales archaeon]
MASDDNPEYFSWKELYSLYGISCTQDRREGITMHQDETSSPGETGRSPTPLTTPIEAYSN